MANIKIPEDAIPALLTLASLDQKIFDSMFSAVDAELPTLSSRQFVNKVAPKLAPLIKPQVVFEILDVVIPLFAIRSRSSVSAEKLAEDIAVSASKFEGGGFSPEKLAMLKARLNSLLSLDKSLGVVAKANEVMVEHDRVFCGSRILSDIRSVFSESPDIASGAMVVHMLQIGFHQMGKHQEFYVALDNNDLRVLKASIERAEKKTLALRLMIEKSNVPYLEV